MRLLLIMAMLLTSVFATNAMSKEITLTTDNTLIFDSPFDGKSVGKLIQEAKEMDAKLKSGYPIYLFLNTPGGSIQAGVELIEALKGLNRPVHTVTLYAASMGWQLLQHLGTRYVLDYAVLMSHKARGQISGEFGGGLSQMDSRYGLWLRRINKMDEQTVKRTNGKKSLKQYRSDYDNELWVNGFEAVKHGYADEVVTVKCRLDEKPNRVQNIRFFGMNIELEMSSCPIITYPVGISVNIRTNKGYMSMDKFLEEGGKFGKNCRKKDTPPRVSSYSGEVVDKGRKAELCAMDETLTFDKIEKSKEKAKLQVTQRAKPIYMTFFSSERY
jgi:ATP-dependent protease ClpP protease subunit